MDTDARGRPFVAVRSPVEGLTRRQLPFIPVFAQSVAGVAPSAAAAVVPALVISTAGGGGAIVAFVCASVVILMVAGCLRPMARRMAAVGGIYTYTARALGPGVAVPTGWSALLGYGTVGMAAVLAVGTYLSHILTAAGLTRSTPIALIIGITVIASLVAGMVMMRGIRLSAWVTLLIECVSIVIVALLCLMLAIKSSTAPVDPALNWDGDFQSTAVGVVVAVSAFVGFESSTTLSGEALQPFRSVPRTLRWTPLATAVLYLLAVSVQATVLHNAPASVGSSSTPLVQLLVADGAPALAALLDVGIAASFFACTLASINALVRVLFCMGREGVAPRALGRTHSKFKTPAVAILAAMPIVALAPIILLAAGATPEQGLRIFLTLSACGYLGSYLAASISAPVLLRRIGESSPGIWILGAATTTILLFLAGIAAISALSGSSPLVLIYAGFLLTSVLYVLVLRRWAPHRLQAVGIYDETQPSDLFETSPFR